MSVGVHLKDTGIYISKLRKEDPPLPNRGKHKPNHESSQIEQKKKQR
jgi:hypothetical protein